jgi:hypothetical protein
VALYLQQAFLSILFKQRQNRDKIGNIDFTARKTAKNPCEALSDGRYILKHFVTALFCQFTHNAPQRFQHGCCSALISRFDTYIE